MKVKELIEELGKYEPELVVPDALCMRVMQALLPNVPWWGAGPRPENTYPDYPEDSLVIG